MDRAPPLLERDLPPPIYDGLRGQGQGAVLLQLAEVHLTHALRHPWPAAALPAERLARRSYRDSGGRPHFPGLRTRGQSTRQAQRDDPAEGHDLSWPEFQFLSNAT